MPTRSGTSSAWRREPSVKPIAIMRMRNARASALDTQTVTTATSGSVPDRLRGFINGLMGSISDGTSNIFGPGNAITALYWDENGGAGQTTNLTIASATDTGWTTLTIGSTVLTRASASFVGETWTWVTNDTLAAQPFGSNGDNIVCYFD